MNPDFTSKASHLQKLELAQQLGHTESINFWRAVIEKQVPCPDAACQECATNSLDNKQTNKLHSRDKKDYDIQVDYISKLDDNLIAKILRLTKLKFNEIIQLEIVCKRWRDIIRNIYCKEQETLSLGAQQSSACRYSIDNHQLSHLDWVGSIRCHAETKERLRESEVSSKTVNNYEPIFSAVNPVWFENILQRCPNLQILSLSPNSCSPEILCIQQHVLEIISSCQLEHVEFGYCIGLKSDRQPFGMTSLSRCASLKHLYFAYTDIDDAALCVLLQKCPQLEIITLYGAGNPQQYVTGKSAYAFILKLALATNPHSTYIFFFAPRFIFEISAQKLAVT